VNSRLPLRRTLRASFSGRHFFNVFPNVPTFKCARNQPSSTGHGTRATLLSRHSPLAPLFSITSALFCASQFRIPFLFNVFRTLCTKHRGVGVRPPLRRFSIFKFPVSVSPTECALTQCDALTPLESALTQNRGVAYPRVSKFPHFQISIFPGVPRRRLLHFVVLRVAAPGVPAVGVSVSRLQADQPPVRRSRVDFSLCKRRLERDRRFHRIRKEHFSRSIRILLMEAYDALSARTNDSRVRPPRPRSFFARVTNHVPASFVPRISAGPAHRAGITQLFTDHGSRPARQSSGFAFTCDLKLMTYNFPNA